MSQVGHVPAAKNQIKASSVSLCFFMVVLELNLGGLKPEPCSESCWQKEFDKIIYNQTGSSKIYNKNTIRYHYHVNRLLT